MKYLIVSFMIMLVGAGCGSKPSTPSFAPPQEAPPAGMVPKNLAPLPNTTSVPTTPPNYAAPY